MKKILLLIISAIIIFSFSNSFNVFWSCNYDVDWDFPWTFTGALNSCLSWTPLVDGSDVSVTTDWFWVTVEIWAENIAIYLWIFAVWSIVFWALMMTLSTWEDDKIKKAKDIIKWWIIWFLWLIFAQWIIKLIVRIMYSI